MTLVDFAKSELDRIVKDEDGMQAWMNKQIIEIVETFAKQDHSGFSASYALEILKRVLAYKPITPLTGEDDEWGTGASEDQNRRCPSVFRKPDGKAYDIDAVIVSDNGGITWYTSNRFRKEITFPYYPPDLPEKVYIEYKEDVPLGETGDEFDIITDDPERIKALYERKREEFGDYF